ncbi:MAG: hypothetical protein ACI9S8_000481 [Chlamydiales bacterium]|jgi:hypothetical protein
MKEGMRGSLEKDVSSRVKLDFNGTNLENAKLTNEIVEGIVDDLGLDKLVDALHARFFIQTQGKTETAASKLLGNAASVAKSLVNRAFTKRSPAKVYIDNS